MNVPRGTSQINAATRFTECVVRQKLLRAGGLFVAASKNPTLAFVGHRIGLVLVLLLTKRWLSFPHISDSLLFWYHSDQQHALS